MSRATTTAKWTLPVVGGALVVILQTPPDTAATNAALWIEKITGYLPDLPPWADAAGTALGAALILTPLFLWIWKKRRKRRATDFKDLEKRAMPTPRPKRSATDTFLDAYDRVSRQTLADARIKKAAELAPDLLGHIPRREVVLAEALGWAAYGVWGKPYHGRIIGFNFGNGIDPETLLARFVELARDGKFSIWGRRNNPGYYQKIPPSHWNDDRLMIADVFGTITTGGDNPYRDLMLNRAEVEREWPHEG